jgi:hypothetical protein
MSTEEFESTTKTETFNPFTLLNKATSVFCRLSGLNLEILGKGFLRYSDLLTQCSTAKKPEEILHVQKNCMEETLHTGLEDAQKLMHIYMDTLQTITRCGKEAATAAAATAKSDSLKPSMKKKSTTTSTTNARNGAPL